MIASFEVVQERGQSGDSVLGYVGRQCWVHRAPPKLIDELGQRHNLGLSGSGDGVFLSGHGVVGGHGLALWPAALVGEVLDEGLEVTLDP